MFSGIRCLRVSETSQGVSEGSFCWIWVKMQYFFSIKMEEPDLKLFMFNYWNDLVLDSVETYFLEVGAYVSLTRATTGLWEGCFCWIWVKVSHFFKYKNGGVKLLKGYCLKLNRNIFSGSWCIRTSGTSHLRFLRVLFLLNFSENTKIFCKIKREEWDQQTLLFNYCNNLVLS